MHGTNLEKSIPMSLSFIGYINRYEKKKSCNHKVITRPADYKVIKLEAPKYSAPGIIYLVVWGAKMF